MLPAELHAGRAGRRRGAVRAALAVPQERAAPWSSSPSRTGRRSPSPAAPTSASRACINALVRQRGLARTSNTPGRTQELNYFETPDVALYPRGHAGLRLCRGAEGQGRGLDPAGEGLSARAADAGARVPADRRAPRLEARRPRADGADGRGRRLLPGGAHQGRQGQAAAPGRGGGGHARRARETCRPPLRACSPLPRRRAPASPSCGRRSPRLAAAHGAS